MFLLQPHAMRRTSLRSLAFVSALSVAGVAAVATPAAAATDEDGNVVIDIVGITDYHGRLAAGSGAAGAAVLAGAVDSVRAQNPSTAFVSSGDNIGATTFVSAVQNDTPTLDVLGLMRLDVSAVGNHELDKGAADFEVRVNDESDFPYVLANVTGLAGVQPFDVWTSPEGVRVGFIGTITPALPSLVSPAGIAGVQVTDPVAAVNTVADQLSDGDEANGEADIIVVLAHDGAEGTGVANLSNGTDFANLVAGARANGNVDAIMAGHTHLAYVHDLTGDDGDLLVTQAGQYSEVMSRLTFTYDQESRSLVRRSAEIVPLSAAAFPADPAVAEVVAKAVADAAVVGQEPIGSITTDLRRAVRSNGADDRGGESTLGNLIADIQLDATRELGAQIVFMNPGGIRTDLLYAGDTTLNPRNTDGVVTYEEAAVVQPFANTLVTFEITGAGIKQALEQQWQPVGESRAFLKLGVSQGFAYVFDATRPVGDRILSMTLDGAPIVADQTYKVAANSFLASGGDNFGAFGAATGHADSGRVDLQVFVDYMAANSPVAPPAEQRSVGISLGGDLVVGRSTPIALSSLLFSADIAQGGETVSVFLDDFYVGEETIDPTITDGADLTGQAAFDLQVPGEATAGEYLLTVVTRTTTASLPVTVRDAVDADGQWYLTNGLAGIPQDLVDPIAFGPGTPDVYLGDWDGDGIDTPAYRVGNTFYIRNSLTSGAPDDQMAYGQPGDVVYVGDWDGDGKDTFAVRRGNEFFVSNTLDGGEADVRFWYGKPDDEPFVGDWDGDGKDTIAVRRGNAWHVRDTLTSGNATLVFWYGRPGEPVLVGDWDGDGRDTPAIRRGTQVHVRNTLTSGNATYVPNFGQADDIVLVGDLTGDGKDTLGIYVLPR